ncbi:DUF559 domain-containing protein [Luedemannella flava]
MARRPRPPVRLAGRRPARHGRPGQRGDDHAPGASDPVGGRRGGHGRGPASRPCSGRAGSRLPSAVRAAAQRHRVAAGAGPRTPRMGHGAPLEPPAREHAPLRGVPAGRLLARGGVVVEVDGPEHRRPVLFANDRRRDNALTIDGLHVLRFGNERVHTDLGRVLFDIETLLHQRRTTEKRHHDQ